MTKELRRLSILMLLMFLALFASTSWIQVVQAETLAENPRNTRALYDSYEVQRGSIIASGAAIASSVPSDDVYSWQRVYTDAPMWAQVTGYINPALGSATGIEQAMNQELSGTAGSQFLARIERIFTGQPPRGSNVVLTLDAAVQRAAFDALGSLQGAVIAIEPATGRVLAMVSSPSFDTNLLASHNTDEVNAVYDALDADPAHPLFNRAIGGDLNPPGLDVQARRRVGGARLGRVDAGVDAAEPGVVPAAAVEQRRLQRQRRRVRSRRHGHHRRCAAAQLQHPVRRARGRARRHGDPRGGGEVRLQRVVRDPARLDAVELPARRSTTRRPRSPASARGR